MTEQKPPPAQPEQQPRDRGVVIAERKAVITELVQNEKINYAGEGLNELSEADASAGVRHHGRRRELQGTLIRLNEELKLDRFSRDEVSE